MHVCIFACLLYLSVNATGPRIGETQKSQSGGQLFTRRDYRVFTPAQAPLFTSAAIAVEAPMKAPANGMDAIAIAAANAMPLFMSFIVSSLKSFPWPTRRGLAGGRHRGLAGGRHRGLASERCRGLPRGYLPAA